MDNYKPNDKSKEIAKMWGTPQSAPPQTNSESDDDLIEISNISNSSQHNSISSQSYSESSASQNTNNKTCGGFSSASNKTFNLWDEISKKSNTDLSSYKSVPWDIEDVPVYLKTKCRLEKKDNYYILKCWNRSYQLLFIGLFWSGFSFPFFGGDLIKAIITGKLEISGSFQNNTGIPDNVAYVIFSLIFIIIGIGLLYFGVQMAFSSTWISFEGETLQVNTAVFRNNKINSFPVQNSSFITKEVTNKDSTSYDVYILNNLTADIHLIIDGLKKDESDNFVRYFNRIIDNHKRAYKGK